jgi:peptidoglycan hydrolase-like protein with peptidoglycan-binding domain
MKIKPLLPRILSLLLIGSTLSLHAAIFDDLVEKIQQQQPHKKRHRHHLQHKELSSEAKWQTALQYLGYYQGKIDGDLSTQASFDAIIAFHAKHHEIETGFLEEADKPYLSEIYHTLLLKKYLSYTGKNRKRKYQKLQAALAIESFYKGKIDGNFGKASKEALNRYSAQFDTNTTLIDPKERVIHEAREKIEKEAEKIKEDIFDPQKYTSASPEEGIETE